MPRAAIRFRLVVLTPLVWIFLTFPIFAQEIPYEKLSMAPRSQTDKKTRDLIDKTIEATGGLSAMNQIAGIEKTATLYYDTDEGRITTRFHGVAVLPSAFYARLESDTRVLTAVMTPDDAYVFKSDSPIQRAALRLNELERRTFLHYFITVPQLLLRQHEAIFGYAGTLTENGKKVEVLGAELRDVYIRWYIDAATGLILRSATGDVIAELSDWRETEGLRIPFREKWSSGGEEIGGLQVTGFRLNPTLDERDLFTNPTTWILRKAFVFGKDAPTVLKTRDTGTSATDRAASRRNSSLRSSDGAIVGSTWTAIRTAGGGYVFVDFFR